MDLPGDDALHWIVSTYAGLRARHGESIGDPVTVQPSAKFFPDEFRLDEESVDRLLRRMIHYAPVSDALTVTLGFTESDEGGAGGCGAGACGSASTAKRRSEIEECGDGYRVWIAAVDVPRAEALAAVMSRAMGALALHEAGEAGGARSSEIAAVACGFGVLLANGAAVWAKGCGGLRMSSATALSVEEVGVALALFTAVHSRRASDVRSHLGPTQRAAFDAALDWVDSNEDLVEALRDRPAMLESGAFALEPVRGPFGRWLHKRRARNEERRSSAAVPPSVGSPKGETAMTDDRRRRLAEARALVDEVMGRWGAAKALVRQA